MLLRAMTEGMDVSASARTITGLIAPYNQPTEVDDGWGSYTEEMAPGAFARAIANPGQVKFLSQHDQWAMPLGRATDMRDDTKGPIGTFSVSKTQAGDEYLELARDGAVDGLSVGFVPVTPGPDSWPRPGDRVRRTEVDLREVSAVTWPAYDGARVSEVRSLLGRVGKTLSSASVDQLTQILQLVAAADGNVDEALVQLSAMAGVPNPNHGVTCCGTTCCTDCACCGPNGCDPSCCTDPNCCDPSCCGPTAPAGRGMSLKMARRRMRLLSIPRGI